MGPNFDGSVQFETNQKRFTAEGPFKEIKFAARNFKADTFFMLDDGVNTPELKDYVLAGIEAPIPG